MEFVEPEDEPNLFRNPLPPDDRLWRHPSEMGASDVGLGLPAGLGSEHIGDRTGALGDDPSPGQESRPSMWLVAAVSAVSAGLLAGGLALVVVGLIGGNDLRPVVERRMEPRPIDASSPTGVVDVANRAQAAVAQIRLDGGATVVGSGVIFRSDGYMLTNASVVGDATSVRVMLDSGQEVTGRVVGSDPETDTAVVKLDGGPFSTAVLGTTTDLRVGQVAIAIGWPVGLVGGPSLTVGVVSALHRSVRRADGGVLFDMVQTDARVPTGWPGGALLDASGSVIGITTAVVGATDSSGTGTGNGGFGFAIPIDMARAVAEELITTGRVARGWLGVQGADLDRVSSGGLEVAGGAQVGDVMGGSPAERAGIEARDVIVALDGSAVTSMGQLVVVLRQHRPGDTVRLDIMRDQQRMSMEVVLVERPPRA